MPDLSTHVDSIFADISADGPGCAAGVYRNGEVVLAKGWGRARVGEARAISERTTFELGSAAKPFTALAALMLEERGRLSLDDDVRRHVPELPDLGGTIRVRDLLQHTSGLRDVGTIELLTGHELHTMPEFLSMMARQHALNFGPGTQHEYSHSDFPVLAVVIERVVGEPFGAWLEREVLQPMGMTSTRVHDARNAVLVEPASGHGRSPAGVQVVAAASRMVGGQNVYTSIADLRHFDKAMSDAANGRHPLLARMLTRPVLRDGDTIPYAYGLRLEEHRGQPTVSRGGHSPGVRTEFVRFPRERVTVAVFCNADHLVAPERARNIADAVLGDRVQPRKPLPPRTPAAPLSVAELQRYVGHYASPGSFDHSRFTIIEGKLAERLQDTVQTMTWLGGGVFFGDGSPGDFRVAFTPDSTPGGMRLDWVVEGEVDGSAQRLPEAAIWRPDAATLAGYAGSWFSPDLDATWTLEPRTGTLVLRRPNQPDVSLEPLVRNVFTRGFGAWNEPLTAQFVFGRDSAGRVTSFTVTTPPGADVVRDLRFDRVAR